MRDRFLALFIDVISMTGIGKSLLDVLKLDIDAVSLVFKTNQPVLHPKLRLFIKTVDFKMENSPGMC